MRKAPLSTAAQAVSAGMPRQAPTSKPTPSGNGTAKAAGSTTASAAVPNGRCHWALNVHTRSPSREAGTPSPTASTTPAPSLCGVTSAWRICGARRLFTSDGFTPDACRRTRTSPGPGAGSGTLVRRSTSRAGPVRS